MFIEFQQASLSTNTNYHIPFVLHAVSCVYNIDIYVSEYYLVID